MLSAQYVVVLLVFLGLVLLRCPAALHMATISWYSDFCASIPLFRQYSGVPVFRVPQCWCFWFYSIPYAPIHPWVHLNGLFHFCTPRIIEKSQIFLCFLVLGEGRSIEYTINTGTPEHGTTEHRQDLSWVLHLDSKSAVGDIHVFHARCNTFESMLCNK